MVVSGKKNLSGNPNSFRFYIALIGTQVCYFDGKFSRTVKLFNNNDSIDLNTIKLSAKLMWSCTINKIKPPT